MWFPFIVWHKKHNLQHLRMVTVTYILSRSKISRRAANQKHFTDWDAQPHISSNCWILESVYRLSSTLPALGLASGCRYLLYVPHCHIVILSYCYTVVLLYYCTVILLYCSTVILLYCCTVVLLYGGSDRKLLMILNCLHHMIDIILLV